MSLIHLNGHSLQFKLSHLFYLHMYHWQEHNRQGSHHNCSHHSQGCGTRRESLCSSVRVGKADSRMHRNPPHSNHLILLKPIAWRYALVVQSSTTIAEYLIIIRKCIWIAWLTCPLYVAVAGSDLERVIYEVSRQQYIKIARTIRGTVAYGDGYLMAVDYRGQGISRGDRKVEPKGKRNGWYDTWKLNHHIIMIYSMYNQSWPWPQNIYYIEFIIKPTNLISTTWWLRGSHTSRPVEKS